MRRTAFENVSRASSLVYRTGVSEIALVGLAFVAYSLARQAVAGRASEAMANASQLVRLERSLGIFLEGWLQELVLADELLIRLFNAVYTYGHLPLVAVVGLWLFFFRRPRYPAYRNALLASGAIGLVTFNLFPMAPPRLMPWPDGMVDTLGVFSSINYHSGGNFVNQYAAMPSIHVAWNLLASLSLAAAVQRLSLRIVSMLSPLLMSVAVVVTGNHFILDVVAGYLVAGLALVVALSLAPQAREVWLAATGSPARRPRPGPMAPR